VIDSRDVLYFASLITIFILLTKIVLESRKWETQGKHLRSGIHDFTGKQG